MNTVEEKEVMIISIMQELHQNFFWVENLYFKLISTLYYVTSCRRITKCALLLILGNSGEKKHLL